MENFGDRREKDQKFDSRKKEDCEFKAVLFQLKGNNISKDKKGVDVPIKSKQVKAPGKIKLGEPSLAL